MQTNQLTIVVPGLLDPVPHLKQIPAQELPELPVLSSILTYGQISNDPKTSHDTYYEYYACILNELGMLKSCDNSTENNLSQSPMPIASCYYSFDQPHTIENSETQDKWIMRLDPCFMAPDRDQLILAHRHNDDLSFEEAQQLVNEINLFFDEIEENKTWTVKAISTNQWFLIADKPIRIQTVPTERVLGQPVKHHLLKGDDKNYWLNLSNEFQMILHNSQVNRIRQENGQIPVNSLWFWGAGKHIEMTELNKCRSEQNNFSLYSNNDFALGIAKLANQRYVELPDNSYFEYDNNQSSIIYVVNDLIQSLYQHDVLTWLDNLQQFEASFLKPLLYTISKNKSLSVKIISPTGRFLTINKKQTKRWWKRIKPYNEFY